MPIIEHSAIVPFSTSQMYDLVNDIEQYPAFLPWCPQATVLHRNEEEIKATLHFSQGILGKSFTTLNTLSPSKRVEMRLVEGPFQHLEGAWHFEAMEDKTSKITFNLSFEFNNKLLALTIGPLFQNMIGTMVQAFSDRARQIYVPA